MATHSSIFAWRIPWTEEPVEVKSMQSQRVGYDRSDLAHTQSCFSNLKESSVRQNKVKLLCQSFRESLGILEGMKHPGWKKNKLESRLPGEISITSYMKMTPPLC